MDTYSHVAPGLQKQAAQDFDLATGKAKPLDNEFRCRQIANPKALWSYSEDFFVPGLWWAVWGSNPRHPD